MRGRKSSLYEGGIRQPLIMYWRGHMKPGTRDEESVGQGVDLLPTVADATGLAVPDGADGTRPTQPNCTIRRTIAQRSARAWSNACATGWRRCRNTSRPGEGIGNIVARHAGRMTARIAYGNCPGVNRRHRA
ncbi:sulfatase-like hydrolase/transferase [Stakelama saccharophila]|uniref:Sulfatase-like hydrolase/transferase n=1 Tax=Stakelama saccharophila TaxID=3075605 RepID=A0ABZ0BCU7_9SPHN|nr:sulfatase-like hydrolase/transferase [Stakelama sp. W311]WNO54683.1 sulfatase-like hydrolase/transferase [Stakelama sp. W311]